MFPAVLSFYNFWLGILDPNILNFFVEYGLGGKASASGDVYSFGILLLEMIIAKKPTDSMFQEGLGLNKFIPEVHKSKILDIADPRLFKDYESVTPSRSSTSSIGGESSSSSNNTIA